MLKATAFDPQDRYHSARELKEAVLSSSEYSDEKVQTAVQNSASNNKPIEDKASFSSIKEKVGKVYNAVLFALAALIVFIVFGATFFPNEQGLEYTSSWICRLCRFACTHVDFRFARQVKIERAFRVDAKIELEEIYFNSPAFNGHYVRFCPADHCTLTVYFST